MSKFCLVLFASLIFIACGSQDHSLTNSESYLVQENLGAVPTVTLSFDQVFLFKSIAVGKPQSTRCLDIAQDYSQKTGIKLDVDNLKMDFESLGRHCSKRNVAKQCESYQYIYRFHCEFRSL